MWPRSPDRYGVRAPRAAQDVHDRLHGSSIARIGQALVKGASSLRQKQGTSRLTQRSRGADASFTGARQHGAMPRPEETLLTTEDDPIDGDDEAGWGRLPPVERADQDGPVSDYRPFRDDPE